MSPRAERIAWWIVAGLFVLAMAVVCLSNIRQTLDRPIFAELAYGGAAKLEHVTGGTAHAALTGVTTVGVELRHVTSQLQWLLALSEINKSVLLVAAVLAFGVVWIRTRAGRPFARSVTVSLTSLAIVVAVLGTLQEVLDSWIGLREAYEAVGNNTNQLSPYADPTGFEVSGLGILIALAIGVLATAFAIGARLTKETDGLV